MTHPAHDIAPTTPVADAGAPVIGPEHAEHPDHRLYTQIRRGVHALDAECGRAPDEISERMTLRLIPLARQAGLKRVDHVVLSRHLGEVESGELVFVVQGELDDPAHLRAHCTTQEAVDMPREASLARLDAVYRELAAQRSEGG
jgi:hypothetical protein